MSALDLKQAASASGLSPRDLRLMLEAGELPGRLASGRWLVDPVAVEGLAPPRPAPPESAEPPAHVLAQTVERLERELTALRTELDLALERIAELEGADPRRPVRRSDLRLALSGKQLARPAARRALNPLFEQTEPGD